MINDRHRAITENIIKELSTKTSLDKKELHKIGGEVYDILKWLTKGQVIDEANYGYSKGQNFYKFTTLDDLLNPKKETPTVIVEYKKDWKDHLYRWFAIGQFVVIIICTPITLNIQSNSNRLEQENSRLLDTLLLRGQKITDLENLLKTKDREIEETQQTLDSLGQRIEIEK